MMSGSFVLRKYGLAVHNLPLPFLLQLHYLEASPIHIPQLLGDVATL